MRTCLTGVRNKDLNYNSLASAGSTATYCHITGVAFVINDPDHPRHRTLDRVDANKGYTDDNTIAVTKEANALKNVIAEHPSGTIDAECFHKLAMFINEHQPIKDLMNFRSTK